MTEQEAMVEILAILQRDERLGLTYHDGRWVLDCVTTETVSIGSGWSAAEGRIQELSESLGKLETAMLTQSGDYWHLDKRTRVVVACSRKLDHVVADYLDQVAW